jgi:hypothetical protein
VARRRKLRVASVTRARRRTGRSFAYRLNRRSESLTICRSARAPLTFVPHTQFRPRRSSAAAAVRLALNLTVELTRGLKCAVDPVRVRPRINQNGLSHLEALMN